MYRPFRKRILPGAVAVCMVGLLCVSQSLAAAKADKSPVSVTTIKSVDDLLASVKYLLRIAGQEEQARQLEGMIAAFSGGDAFGGIDTKKPLGALVFGLPVDGDQPPAVIFIPVTKQDDFLEQLRMLGADPVKGDKGIYEVDTPFGVSLYLRFAHKHAFVAVDSELLTDDLPRPADVIPEINESGLLVSTFMIDQVPDELKREFLDDFHRGLEREREQRDNESDQEYQVRMMALQVTEQAVETLVRDGKNLAVSLGVDRDDGQSADRDDGQIWVEITVTPKSGSDLARRVRVLGHSKPVAPVHLEIAVGKIAKMFLPEEGEGKLGKVIDMLDENADAKVSLQLQGGETLSVRLNVDAQLIRLISVVAPQPGVGG